MVNDTLFTICDYLKGKIKGIDIPDNTLLSICADVMIEPNALVSDVTLKQKELALAWLYVWIAGSPTQTGTTRDASADWEHSEGGERMSANVLKQYLAMANKIFDKYDQPLVGEESWGLVGHGFCNPRRRR